MCIQLFALQLVSFSAGYGTGAQWKKATAATKKKYQTKFQKMRLGTSDSRALDTKAAPHDEQRYKRCQGFAYMKEHVLRVM